MRRATVVFLCALAACDCGGSAKNPPIAPPPRDAGPHDAGGGGSDAGGGADGGYPAGSFGDSCNGTPTTLSGTAFMPNGTDPVSKATVAIFDVAPTPLDRGVYCQKCSATDGGQPLRAVDAGPDGKFVLDISAVTKAASFYVTVRKGRFRKIIPSFAITPCQDNPLSASDSSLPGTSAQGDLPKIAVSSGNKDHLESVLQRMGITEYDCLIGTSSSSDTCKAAGSTTNLGTVLGDSAQLASYALLFIACAPNSPYLPTGPTDPKSVNLNQWVNAGGKLVVTDDSYDHVEQAFPDAVDFQGPSAAAGTPQPLKGADVGTAAASLTGTVTDADLAAWLGLFPGALGAGGTVNLVGFLSSWAVMRAPGTGTSSVVHGNATWTGGSGDVPLTAQFEVNNCGRVIFSSYHTDASATDGGAGMLPQERILEYLMMQVATCTFGAR